MIRCSECGSWEAQCMSDTPVDGCGCARCLAARLKACTLERDVARELGREMAAKLSEAERLLLAGFPTQALHVIQGVADSAGECRSEQTAGVCGMWVDDDGMIHKKADSAGASRCPYTKDHRHREYPESPGRCYYCGAAFSAPETCGLTHNGAVCTKPIDHTDEHGADSAPRESAP